MKFLTPICTLFGVILAGCNPAQAPAGLSVTELCTETVNDYAHSRDLGDVELFESLFTDDAVFTIRGNRQEGRDAIVAAMKSRAGAMNTRHVMGSIKIDVQPDGMAKGRSYVAVYGGPKDDTAKYPLAGSSPAAIATYVDEFRLEDGTCKFSRRDVLIDFE